MSSEDLGISDIYTVVRNTEIERGSGDLETPAGDLETWDPDLDPRDQAWLASCILRILVVLVEQVVGILHPEDPRGPRGAGGWLGACILLMQTLAP